MKKDPEEEVEVEEVLEEEALEERKNADYYTHRTLPTNRTR